MITFCKHLPIFTTAEQSPYYKSSLSSKKPNRRKRQTVPSTKSNFKGQTQTQYISFDNEGKEDKGGMAEAVAEREKSRATVRKCEIFKTNISIFLRIFDIYIF